MSDGAAPSMQQSQAYFDKHTVQLQMGPPGGRPHMAAAAPAPKKHSCFRRTLAVIACVVIVGGIALLALVLAVTKDDAQAPEHTSTVAFRVRRAFADASRGGSRRLVQSVLAAGTVSQSATGAPTGGHVDSLALFVQEVYLCREVACDGTYAGDSTVTGAADQCTVGRVDIGTAWESHCVAVFKHPNSTDVGDLSEPGTQQCTDAALASSEGWMVDFATAEAEQQLSGEFTVTADNEGTYYWALLRAHPFWRLNATVDLAGSDMTVHTQQCGSEVCGSECFEQSMRTCTGPTESAFGAYGGQRFQRCSHNMTGGSSVPVFFRATQAGAQSDLLYRIVEPAVATVGGGDLTVDFAYTLDGLVYGDLAGRHGKDNNGIENHDGVTDGAFGIHNHPLGIVPIARNRTTEQLLKYTYRVQVSPAACSVVPGHPCQRGNRAGACQHPRFGGGPTDTCDPAAGDGEHCRPIDVGMNTTGMSPLAKFDIVVEVYYVVPSGERRPSDFQAVRGVTVTPRRAHDDAGEFALPFRAMAAEDIEVDSSTGVPNLSIGNHNHWWGLTPTIANMTLLGVVGGSPVEPTAQVMLQGIPVVHRRCGPSSAPDYAQFMGETDPDYPVGSDGLPGGPVQSPGGGNTNWPFSNCQETEVYFTCPHTLQSVVAVSNDGDDSGSGSGSGSASDGSGSGSDDGGTVVVDDADACAALRGTPGSIDMLPHIHDFMTSRSDRFLMDFPILNGHPYPGEGDPPTDRAALNPHDGIHIYPGNVHSQYSGSDPLNYPPIYAPVDGYLTSASLYQSTTWSGYTLLFAVAHNGNGGVVKLDISVEPQVQNTWAFYQTFIFANVGEWVCKGDVLATFYLPPGACDRVGNNTCPPAHIHSNLQGHGKAPALWTQAVVDEFHSYWNDRFARDKPPGPGGGQPLSQWDLFPPCMGYRVAPHENPFDTGYQYCL